MTTIAKSDLSGGVRTVAICSTFERAEEIILTNEFDIWEYSYMDAVIEECMPDHMYGGMGDRQQWWYHWTGDADGGYQRVPNPPERFARVVGFGIG